ncbi:helicase associated domain-containing protein [Streptomyces atratus]|uniref:helicase associated domain-containing protein n=1 Tax=Streptomyces atratus TaxID=1893 RepID=UPI0021A5A69D|nr:helicase associated domain-containing protein [Streptomyces atratus]MCT2543347.1 helicase associated domain-containing protein [Streptomyces atratus]
MNGLERNPQQQAKARAVSEGFVRFVGGSLAICGMVAVPVSVVMLTRGQLPRLCSLCGQTCSVDLPISRVILPGMSNWYRCVVESLRAAQQFHGREGHLRVPRKHVEHLAGAAEDTAGPSGHQAGADGVVVVKLGTSLDNVRKRAGRLTERRRADLDHLGMRW